MKMAMDHKYILIALVASAMGAYSRVRYDQDEKVVNPKRKMSYFSASLFVAYILYELLQYLQYRYFEYADFEKATGFICAIGGLISSDIIDFLIKQLPKILKSKFFKYMNEKPDKDEN